MQNTSRKDARTKMCTLRNGDAVVPWRQDRLEQYAREIFDDDFTAQDDQRQIQREIHTG